MRNRLTGLRGRVDRLEKKTSYLVFMGYAHEKKTPEDKVEKCLTVIDMASEILISPTIGTDRSPENIRKAWRFHYFDRDKFQLDHREWPQEKIETYLDDLTAYTVDKFAQLEADRDKQNGNGHSPIGEEESSRSCSSLVSRLPRSLRDDKHRRRSQKGKKGSGGNLPGND